MVNRIKELRKESGWTVLQLAAKSGVPVEIVKKVEEADNFEEIDPADAMKVARTFLVKYKLKIDEVFII